MNRSRTRLQEASLSLLLATVFAFLGLTGVAQEGPDTGIIVGQVDLAGERTDDDFAEAVLLSPEWAAVWNSEVQRRIDSYFATNIAAINRDRELFELISKRAQRESTMSVISAMQGSLGTGFGAVVLEIGADGSFEFVGVPFGDYRIIVIAGIGDDGRIWTGAVTIRSPIPEFVELQDRIQ